MAYKNCKIIVMETTTEGFVNIRDWMPYPNKPLILKTNYGIREGMWGIFGLGFMLTDCTHPAMNCHMSLYNVTEWKYVNNEDAENLLFTKNTWMRKAEADELLRRIKKPIWQRNKIYQWLVKVAK
jgi:hypothetical protein